MPNPDRPLNPVALIVAGAFFMEFLDGTVITTALPQMAKAFGADPVTLSIGITAYLLMLAVFIPASAWVADRYGTRTVFGAAIGVFTVASVLCGISNSLWTFTAARILQGLGGAMMVPVGRQVVLRSTEKRHLVHAIASLTWPALIAPVLGPPIGGLITTYADWRWIFFLNVPLGLIGIALTVWKVPQLRAEQRQPFDLLGFALVGSALASLMYGLEEIGHHSAGWQSPVLFLAISGTVGILAVRHVRRHPAPVLDLWPLSVASFAAATWGGSVFRITVNTVPFLLPLLFQVGFGLSAFDSGLLVLATFAGNLGMKPLTTPIMRRWGLRTVMLANGMLTAATVAACCLLLPDTPWPVTVAILFAGGLCRSMQFTAINTLFYTDIPSARMSRASALGSVVQQMAMGHGRGPRRRGAARRRPAARRHGPAGGGGFPPGVRLHRRGDAAGPADGPAPGAGHRGGKHRIPAGQVNAHPTSTGQAQLRAAGNERRARVVVPAWIGAAWNLTARGTGAAMAPLSVQGRSGVSLVSDNLTAFAMRGLSARAATRTLDLQYYTWEEDVTGRLLMREVLKAADRGVRVRLLLDDLYVQRKENGLAALGAASAHPGAAVQPLPHPLLRAAGRSGRVPVRRLPPEPQDAQQGLDRRRRSGHRRRPQHRRRVFRCVQPVQLPRHGLGGHRRRGGPGGGRFRAILERRPGASDRGHRRRPARIKEIWRKCGRAWSRPRPGDTAPDYLRRLRTVPTLARLLSDGRVEIGNERIRVVSDPPGKGLIRRSRPVMLNAVQGALRKAGAAGAADLPLPGAGPARHEDADPPGAARRAHPGADQLPCGHGRTGGAWRLRALPPPPAAGGGSPFMS